MDFSCDACIGARFYTLYHCISMLPLIMSSATKNLRQISPLTNKTSQLIRLDRPLMNQMRPGPFLPGSTVFGGSRGERIHGQLTNRLLRRPDFAMSLPNAASEIKSIFLCFISQIFVIFFSFFMKR